MINVTRHILFQPRLRRADRADKCVGWHQRLGDGPSKRSLRRSSAKRDIDRSVMRVLKGQDMKTIEIVEAGLKANGFDGLVIPGECGCVLGEISPGGCLNDHCEGAYRHDHSNGTDWITSTKKDGITDADIERVIAECC